MEKKKKWKKEWRVKREESRRKKEKERKKKRQIRRGIETEMWGARGKGEEESIKAVKTADGWFKEQFVEKYRILSIAAASLCD